MNTYDPKKVNINFIGVPFTGFAKDNFLSISRKEDGFVTYTGADGEYSRALNRNHSGEAKIKLRHDSPTNTVLAALYVADEKFGAGSGPFMVNDLSGTAVAFAADAWIQKMPDLERGKETGEVEWVFGLGAVDIFTGGDAV